MKDEDKDKFYASFGRRLSGLRQNAGLTQQEFADEIGLSRVSVANIERGRQIVYVDRLAAWAKVLRCRVMDLLPSQWKSRSAPKPVPPTRRVFHHYFPGDGRAFTEDYDPATLRTGCGVPFERVDVMPEINHVTCEACLEAYRGRTRYE